MKKIAAWLLITAILLPFASAANAEGCNHNWSSIWAEVAHPHYYYHVCGLCGITEYTGGHATKNHGDGSWGSWTCPDCGTHTFTGQSCTSQGSCACGATTPALGHSYQAYVYSSHPHRNYFLCNRCGDYYPLNYYSTFPHGNGSSGTCSLCGSHNYNIHSNVLLEDQSDGSDVSVSRYSCACGDYANLLEMYLAGTDGYVDYYVTSGYTSYISSAANTWNSYTGDKLRDITPNYLIIPINADAYVSTVYVVTNEYAARVVWNSKQIELNKYWFDIYENGGNSSYCVNAITHEFGHALGIDHTVDTGDIMYWRTTPLTTLSNQDKKAYDVSCLRF